MSRTVRRVALYGFLGSGNIGNDASFETVLSWLRSAHPSIEVSCITIAPDEVTARYGVPAVPLAWRSSGQPGNWITEAFRKLRGRLQDVFRSYTLAGSVDAIIVPGMGVLEDNLGVRPWGMPLWLFLTAAACRLRKRRFVLLDVGAEWAPNPLTRWLYVATVNLAAHVSYRDDSSAMAMARAGAREPDAVAPDVAFAHPATTQAEPEPGHLVVGVMAYYGPADDPVRGAEVRRHYVATMAEALGRLASAGSRIVLVGGDRADVEIARDVHSAVATLCPGLPDDAVEVREPTTFAELTDIMMRAEVVIASRFHNLICALRLARPTVSVGYAGKNRDLMRAVGVDGYCQNIGELNANALVEQVGSARRDTGALTARIRTGAYNYTVEVESLLKQVARDGLNLTEREPVALDVVSETR